MKHDPLVYMCPSCDFRALTLSWLVQHVEGEGCDERIDGGSKAVGKMLHYLRFKLG